MNDELLKQLLEQLHIETAKLLLEKIQTGTAKPAEIQAAIALLKHNGIQVDPDKFDEDPLKLLKEEVERIDLFDTN